MFPDPRFCRARDERFEPRWRQPEAEEAGGTFGFLLARLTQEAYPYPLITGGMPVLAAWPTGIVTYELTMLGAVVTTIVVLLISTKLPDRKPKLYDQNPDRRPGTFRLDASRDRKPLARRRGRESQSRGPFEGELESLHESP